MNLLHDLVVVLTSCFLAGLLCDFLRIPPLIGYVCSGTIIGPAGYNLIMSLIQVSSIGEFGVYFVLFVLGLEFSIGRLREMGRMAVLVGTGMLIVTVIAVVAIG